MANAKVKITDGGMRNGCIGELIRSHSDWEFEIKFADGRTSYFRATEFDTLLDDPTPTPDLKDLSNRELQDEFDRLTEAMKACATRINEAAIGTLTEIGRLTAAEEVSLYNMLHAQRQQIDTIWLSR